jgi:SAM-dependent methyltransferase
VCSADATVEFLSRPSVPVHQNLLLADAASARSIARGRLSLHLCTQCGFVFNAAFDPGLLDYGQQYDNSQTCSGAFSTHVDGLVQRLVDGGVRDCRVVEVGCGKGTFLRRLVAREDAGVVGYGFDPTYEGPETDLDGRLRFYRTFYDERAAALPADVVVCRHVIEHVPDPLALLWSVRGALAASAAARVFFETPCVEWILRFGVTWDFFYEHCSLFTAASLAATLTRAGFEVIAVDHVFGGQYLWLEGRVAGTEPARFAAESRVGALELLARDFGRHERRRVEAWRAHLRRHKTAGPIAVWGAGAKGVTFCNLTDPECELISCVVDVNPAKQGKFIAGTGHPIVAPERFEAEAGSVALVLNPNYFAEIADYLAQRGSGATAVNLMRAG